MIKFAEFFAGVCFIIVGLISGYIIQKGNRTKRFLEKHKKGDLIIIVLPVVIGIILMWQALS